MSDVTLQINVAPSDAGHAGITLPHQLRTWSPGTSEIVFTFDVRPPSTRSRFGNAWSENLPKMQSILDRLCAGEPKARVDVVDYDAQHVREIGRMFFARDDVPEKDSRGCAFFSYFHGLASAGHDLILHLDADLLFGGGSETWLDEAVTLLEQNEDVLVTGPLMGPPRADGSVNDGGTPVDLARRAFAYDEISTRSFLVDRGRLLAGVAPLDLEERMPPLKFVKALVQGNPKTVPAEMIISAGMRRHGMRRVDFLGVEPGLWSLHPPYRSAQFLRALPDIVERVERNDVPPGQCGDRDINDSLYDWSSESASFKMLRPWRF